MKIDDCYIEKWKCFSLQLTIVYESKSNILTPEKFKKVYEARRNFPRGYLEFLQIFGSGELEVGNEREMPNSLRFHLANLKWSDTNIGYFKDGVLGMEDTFQGRSRREEKNKQLELLNNSFAFADSDRSEIFLWDLKSYSIKDNSYDIYKTYINSFHSDLVGRDFYDFIESYCFNSNNIKETFYDNINPVFFCRNYRT